MAKMAAIIIYDQKPFKYFPLWNNGPIASQNVSNIDDSDTLKPL